ncbi:insulinase family protein [Candidatus Bipolaricaulota bacterium]|nr:insulinase family protein [Candidatus Bipolaricaulota bacterium]
MQVRKLYTNATEATLDNGLRILVEEVPQSRSVSTGVWIRAGSRDDPENQSGLAHFIEHLAFKGSPTRDAQAISHEIDAAGGHLNAATAKESTFYYADVPADGLATALDILADLSLNPKFDPNDIDLERNVILEEIRGHEDDPEQTAYDLFSKGVWADGHPFARSVVGTRPAIESVQPADIRAFCDSLYQPDNMILAVCGAVKTEQVIRLAEDFFGTRSTTKEQVPSRTAPVFQPGMTHHERPTGMFHVYMGTDAPSAAHDDRIALEVVNSILGDGTSSRLFHSIRETRGLAYAISSYVHSFSDGGMWLTYAGIAPENADTVIGLIRAEFDRMLSKLIPSDELDLAKAKLRGHLILGLEANAARASRLANAVLQRRDILSPDELLVRLDAVTCESAHEALSKYLQPDRLNITTVGPSA